MGEHERAGRWVRVSSGGQDEANQVPDVDGYCAARGYDVSHPPYVVHAKSAYHGEQQAALDQVLADMRAGLISVLVIWHSDRIERRAGKALLDVLAEVAAAGGRVESVKEPTLGQLDFGGQVVTFIAGLVNHEKSRHLAEQVGIAFDAIDAAGAWRGKPPWGFTTNSYLARDGKLRRRLVPLVVTDAEGDVTFDARYYVPEIYRRVTGGQSLAQVARWLESEGVAPVGIAKERADGRGKSGQWWARSIGQLIRNPAYMGRAIVDARTQQTHMCEPLVDAHTWAMAGRALDSRPKRGPVLRENRCALSGAARCWSCGGPLYRIASGRGTSRTYYLRCSGTGADRKSCGAPMMRLDAAEALADEVIGGLARPVYEIAPVPGNEAQIDAQLAALDYERRQVALRGLSWEDEDAERARIRAEYELVAATPRVRDRRMVTDTGVSYGQRWAKLDADGRAEWLRSGEFTVMFTRGAVGAEIPWTATRDGVTLVLEWAPDDEDQDQAA